MRVFLITESKGWSGGAAQTLLLAHWMRNRQHSIWIGCRPGSEIAKRANAENIPTVPIRIKGDLDLIAVVKIAHWVRKNGIDLVHAQHAKAHAVSWLAKCLFHRRLPLVVTRRVSFPVAETVFSRLKYLSPKIDRFVAVSDGIKNVLIAGGVPSRRIEVIRSAVDPSDFQPSSTEHLERLRQMLNLDPEIPLITKVANYSDWKGQRVLLEAAAGYLSRGGNAQFAFVGRDTDGPEMRNWVDQLGLDAHVRLLGFRTDIANLLALSDLSINAATAGEGLSGAIRESLALGVPVIATDVSGNSEIVRDDVTGKLVPPSDPNALAAAMDWMLRHPERAHQMARAGQQWVLNNLSIDQIGLHIENLWSMLIDGRPMRPSRPDAKKEVKEVAVIR